MKLEHFGMAEPGDCRLVFTADAEELERAITAEQAAPDAPQAEEDLLTAAVNRTILEGFSALYEQIAAEYGVTPVTDPDFELLAVNRAEGFRAGAQFYALPPLTLGRYTGFVQAVEPHLIRQLTIEMEINRHHGDEERAADAAGKAALRQQVARELYAQRCVQAKARAEKEVIWQLGDEVTGPLPKQLVGGPNPASNSKLADLIAKAKRMSVPNDNIQRIIKKAEGGDKTEFEAITYEGYGPGGVAVMVETLTDNRNRTAADLRHYFDKNGGNLGAMGCVAFLFSQKGVIDISLEDKDADEAMMDALDVGAEDFDVGEEAAEITTDPENYSAVVKAMEEKGYEILSDDLAMVPMTTTRLTDPDQLKLMGKLLDALEDNDDVQNVWHSLENEEDLPE